MVAISYYIHRNSLKTAIHLTPTTHRILTYKYIFVRIQKQRNKLNVVSQIFFRQTKRFERYFKLFFTLKRMIYNGSQNGEMTVKTNIYLLAVNIR